VRDVLVRGLVPELVCYQQQLPVAATPPRCLGRGFLDGSRRTRRSASLQDGMRWAPGGSRVCRTICTLLLSAYSLTGIFRLCVAHRNIPRGGCREHPLGAFLRPLRTLEL
jgi:hypothetical protein